MTTKQILILAKKEKPFTVIGAFAGVIAAVSFALIHQWLISDIWFSLIIMAPAAALCGLCVSWSYGMLVETPSLGSWVRYNLLYVGLLYLLGGVSIAVYEPITTIPALMALNGPPDELIRQTMPLTILFTFGAGIFICTWYGWAWSRFGATLLTSGLLVLLLGLNVSVLGLVEIPGDAFYLVLEMCGLILAINLVYATVFVLGAWKYLY